MNFLPPVKWVPTAFSYPYLWFTVYISRKTRHDFLHYDGKKPDAFPHPASG